MNTKNQLLCAWSGIVFLLMFILGWWVIAGYIPPPSPTADSAEIAGFYKQDPTLVSFGLDLVIASCIFFPPWLAVISAQMKRIEGGFPVFAYAQLVSGTAAMMIFILPVMIWMVASFRPERNPELQLLISDFGWLWLTMTYAPFVAQNLSIGLVIVTDKRERPVFPRWAGYFNLWTAASFLPASLVVFFKTGPFAWNGIIAFWVPLVVFAIWLVVMFALLLRAIGEQKKEGPSASGL